MTSSATGAAPPARSCAGCHICCSTPSLNEPGLVKPPWQPCPNECAAGCSIYETRPQTCRNYHCLWIKGELPEWAFPMRTGLMVSRDDPSVPAINVIEAHEGAALSYWGERLVKYLGRSVAVNITKRDGSMVQASTGCARKNCAAWERDAWRR